MAFDAQFVLLLPGNIVAGGNVFGGNSHVVTIEDLIQRIKNHQVNGFTEGHIHAVTPAGFGQTDRNIAHVFHAAGDDNLIVPRLDGGCGKRDGFHAGGADFVHGDRGGFLGQAGADHGLTPDILTLSRPDDVADDDFIHGNVPEAAIPLGILLFNRGESFILCRIRRVIFGMGRQSRFESRLDQSFANDQSAQILRGNIFQRAAEGSDRGAHTADNDCV